MLEGFALSVLLASHTYAHIATLMPSEVTRMSLYLDCLITECFVSCKAKSDVAQNQGKGLTSSLALLAVPRTFTGKSQGPHVQFPPCG